MTLNKTEIVVLIEKRTLTILPMRVREEVVETKPAAIYSGVLIDS